ncbi:MAG: CRISPR-associated protein [Veillonella sp.]|nr:CRISPR-associated protein [Veillonella sp.]
MLNSASIIGRYTLTGTVKLTSPLIIRAGVSNDILNDTVDDIVVTYHDGQPFIPGTSLAGVLRQALQGLVPDAELVLFGSIDDKGTQSALQINDIPLDDTNIVVRDGIRIDDVRGVTVDGAKYDFEVIESGQGEKIEKALAALANALQHGIAIGARTVNGFGRIACKDIALEHYDFTKPDHVKAWLTGKSGASVAIPKQALVADRDLVITMDAYLEDTVLIKSIFEEAWEDKSVALFVPGTSVKGVLRHQCGRIIQALGSNDAIVNTLFGYSNDDDKDSRKGRVMVDEIYFDKQFNQEEQPRIRVDRFTGGAMNGALFQDHPVRNTKGDAVTFPLRMTVKNCNDAEAGLVMLLVKDLMTGQVTLGANRTIGYGRVQGKSVTVQYHGESYTIDGNGKVTSGEAAHLENLVMALQQCIKETVNG